jgi:hypothetical protein
VGANLTGANLSGATLRRTDLWGATLTGAIPARADLTEANLSVVAAEGVDWYRANLTDAVVLGATGVPLEEATGPLHQGSTGSAPTRLKESSTESRPGLTKGGRCQENGRACLPSHTRPGVARHVARLYFRHALAPVMTGGNGSGCTACGIPRPRAARLKQVAAFASTERNGRRRLVTCERAL